MFAFGFREGGVCGVGEGIRGVKKKYTHIFICDVYLECSEIDCCILFCGQQQLRVGKSRETGNNTELDPDVKAGEVGGGGGRDEYLLHNDGRQEQ